MPEHDIFCSYAHADNDQGWVDEFVQKLGTVYRKLTGQQVSIFLDRESILTADLWEKRIRTSLEGSQLMLAMVSPSYIRSQWCRREWDIFTIREHELRKVDLLPAEQGLIFPVLLYPLNRGRFGAAEEEFSFDIRQRQWTDLSSQVEGTPIRFSQVREIAERLIDMSTEVQHLQRLRSDPTEILSAPTILDNQQHLEWAGRLSPILTFGDAFKYIHELNSEVDEPDPSKYDELEDFLGALEAMRWRLPSKQELEGLIDPLALSNDPSAKPFPLREPFNSQRFGYLHSGTLIDPSDATYGNYIMNVANGHVFNGLGYRCHIRAVRKVRPSRHPRAI